MPDSFETKVRPSVLAHLAHVPIDVLKRIVTETGGQKALIKLLLLMSPNLFVGDVAAAEKTGIKNEQREDFASQWDRVEWPKIAKRIRILTENKITDDHFATREKGIAEIETLLLGCKTPLSKEQADELLEGWDLDAKMHLKNLIGKANRDVRIPCGKYTGMELVAALYPTACVGDDIRLLLANVEVEVENSDEKSNKSREVAYNFLAETGLRKRRMPHADFDEIFKPEHPIHTNDLLGFIERKPPGNGIATEYDSVMITDAKDGDVLSPLAVEHLAVPHRFCEVKVPHRQGKRINFSTRMFMPLQPNDPKDFRMIPIGLSLQQMNRRCLNQYPDKVKGNARLQEVGTVMNAQFLVGQDPSTTLMLATGRASTKKIGYELQYAPPCSDHPGKHRIYGKAQLYDQNSPNADFFEAHTRFMTSQITVLGPAPDHEPINASVTFDDVGGYYAGTAVFYIDCDEVPSRLSVKEYASFRGVNERIVVPEE